MIILGGLMLAGALCCGGISIVLPIDQLEKALAEQSAEVGEISAEQLRIGMIVIAVIMLGVALPMIILGVFIRRGGKGVAIAGIVLTSILLLLMAINLLSGLVRGGGAPDMVAGLCVMLIPVALLVLQLVWLVQAVRASQSIDMMRMQQQQQYWQYTQQQQQMYGQPGVQPPMSSPPVSMPPPPMPPPPPSPGGWNEPPKGP